MGNSKPETKLNFHIVLGSPYSQINSIIILLEGKHCNVCMKFSYLIECLFIFYKTYICWYVSDHIPNYNTVPCHLHIVWSHGLSQHTPGQNTYCLYNQWNMGFYGNDYEIREVRNKNLLILKFRITWNIDVGDQFLSAFYPQQYDWLCVWWNRGFKKDSKLVNWNKT